MADELSIETLRPDEHTAVVVLAGELDLASCERLRTTTVELLAEGTTRLMLDLSGLSFIDSSGVGMVIGSLKRVRERQGAFAVACDNPAILRIFDITGLQRVLPLRATREEALAVLDEGACS